jgi:hypothetical protein
MNYCDTCAHATDEGDMYPFVVPVAPHDGPSRERGQEPGLWCTLRPKWDQVSRRHWCGAWRAK